MPSDVSLELLAHAAPTARRLPVGIGLCIGASASIALWMFVGLSLRAIL